jgi:uncharacterized RDD family membrane protein YckC
MEAPARAKTYADLGLRATAAILDILILTVLMLLIAGGVGYAGVRPPPYLPAAMAAAYLGLLPATPLRGTFGKRMVGISITDTAGKQLGIGRSLLRLVLWIPSIGIAGAGFLLAAFTRRRQALHDIAAGTIVVRAGATPDEVAEEPAPISGFNRIGLALSLALVALVVHNFLAINDDRRKRDRTIVMLGDARPHQDEVALAIQAKAAMPAVRTLPRNARAMATRADGSIVIDMADDFVPGARIVLRPSTNAKGQVIWKCEASGIHLALVPGPCRP